MAMGGGCLIRLQQWNTRQLLRLIVNVDADTIVTASQPPTPGLPQQDVLREFQSIDPTASLDASGEIVMDGGATRISLIRWEVSDPPAPGLPGEQCLERLVCSALAAAYPSRAACVQNWLMHDPPPDPKEHAWSYMAGWYPQYGCDTFYSNLWNDPLLVSELQASGAWRIADWFAQ